MKTNKKTKVLSFLATLIMLMSLVPMGVFTPSVSAANEYEYAMFPMKTINVSQKAGANISHQGTNNVDFAGNQKVYAPFDCKVVNKGTTYASAHRIIIESTNKVMFADGTYDYMTVLVAHDEDVSDMYVGKKLKQGEYFYHAGKYGPATGIHIHMCVARGKYKGQYENSYGKWQLKNSILPSSALFIDNNTKITNSGGYSWKKVEQVISKPLAPVINTSSAYDIAQNKPVTISWTKVVNATGYIIYINGKEVNRTTNTSYSFNATNVQTYNLTVAAYNAKYTGNQSNKISIVTHAPLNVTFNDHEGNCITATPLKVNYGENAISPEVPIREGYTFLGWDKSLNNITADTVFNPDYKIKTYTVKFFDSKGTVLSSQQVAYGTAATVPENTNPEPGYSFIGWSTQDYACVKEDLNVYGVYDWSNYDLPVLLSNVTATRQEDGYYVYFDLQNYSAAVTRGRAVVSLKTAEGKLIDTTESAAFSIPKNGTRNGMEVFVPSEEVATVAEVIIVNSYHNGVPISEMNTSAISLADNMLAPWTENEPEGAVEGLETKTEYRYKDKEFATSSSATMDGWTLYDTTTTTSTGTTTSKISSFSNESQTRTVTTRTVNKYATRTLYRYMHYHKGSATSPKRYDNSWSTIHYTPWMTSRLTQYGTSSEGNTPKYGYYKCPTCGTTSWWYKEETKQESYVSGTTTYYDYTDTFYTYHFYRWKDWSDWSDVSVDASENKEVETRTLYRWVDHSMAENSSGVTRTVSGNLGESFADKQVALLIYKVDEASDYTNEFVGQQTIAQDGSYSFTFKLREEPTAKTGDFTVALGIEGTNSTMIIDTIPAPVPEYNVTFFSDGVQLGETQCVQKGAAAVPPENPVKEGYTFVGWSCDISNIQGDAEVNAIFVLNKYTVVFVDWVKETVTVGEYFHGEVIDSIEADCPEGYSFAGWEGFEGLDAIVTQNMILTAKYDKQTFEVVFFDFDGNELSRQTVAYKEAAVAPEEPTEDDMVFAGWNSEDDIYEVTCDTCVYAQFEYEETVDDPYADITTNEFNTEQIVSLNCDTENASIYYTTDGSDPAAALEEGLDTISLYTGPITINESCNLSSVAVADKKNNSNVVTETYVINNSSAVSASHLVTIHNIISFTDGNHDDNIVVADNEKVTLDAEGFDLDGFTVTGFYSDENYSNEWDLDQDVVTAKLDLYPKYEQLENTVIFKDENGTVLSEQAVAYGEDAHAPEYIPTEGMTLIGWDKPFNSVTEDMVITAVVKRSEDVVTVNLNKIECSMFVDSMIQLRAIVTPDTAENKNLTWSSSNSDIAQVDEYGLITGVASGTAIISATTVDGVTARCLVKVNEMEDILDDSFVLKDANVTISWTTMPYNGTVQKPTITVNNIAGETLIEGTDYTVTAPAECMAPGSYTYTIAGKGFYSGTVSKMFTIATQTLKAENISLYSATVTYNGKQRTPSVTVKNAAGETLVKGTDYTVSVPAGRTNAGAYVYKIIGKGNYSGTVSKTFTISPQPLKSANVSLYSARVSYNGKQRTPVVTVKNAASETLTAGTDYTVTVPAGRTQPGEYVYTVNGIGNYEGTAYALFEITGEQLKAENVSLYSATVTYNGKVRTPSVTVKNAAGEKLTEGTDYTVTVPAGRKDPGTYTYVISGKGLYTGTVNKVFTITGEQLKAENVSLYAATVTYNGKVRTPSVTVKNAAGEKLTEGADYTVTVPTGRTNVGTYTYKITGKGIYSGTVSKTFTIKEQTLSASNVSLYAATVTYNGKQRTPSVIVKNAAGETLTAGTDYTVTVPAGRTQPGDYTYKIVGKGNYTGTVSKTFTINAQELKAKNVTLYSATVTYNGKQRTPSVTVKNAAGEKLTEGVDYIVSVPSGRTQPGTYTYKIVGVGGYTGMVSKVFTIEATA